MIQFHDSLYYLDPGTGAFLFQVLAAAFVSVGVYFRRIKEFIKVKIIKKHKPN